MSFTIIGTGSALPNRVITNDDLTAFLETSDEWIRTRTGIGQRHVMSTGESVTGLATKAAHQALEQAGITPKELDFILCATIGGDCLAPSLACLVQAEIGADCPALDVNAACSGFVYALDVAAGLYARKRAKHILVIGAEGMSRISDWNDRSTCVLFGDAAGAVVLAPGNDLLDITLTANGCQEALYAPYPQGNLPGRENADSQPYLKMNGPEVYKFAVNAIVKGVQGILSRNNMEEAQVDHVFLHQANIRIIETAQKKLSIPPQRYAVNIQDVGNTSAASVPLLLDTRNKSGKIKAGDIVILNAFGAGLTTGTALLRWQNT